MGRSAKLIVAGKEVTAVSVRCVFPRLLTDTKQISFVSLWGWLRKTISRYEALLKGYIKPRVTTVLRDHINRWTVSRLRLPADVFRILEYLKEHNEVSPTKRDPNCPQTDNNSTCTHWKERKFCSVCLCVWQWLCPCWGNWAIYRPTRPYSLWMYQLVIKSTLSKKMSKLWFFLWSFCFWDHLGQAATHRNVS